MSNSRKNPENIDDFILDVKSLLDDDEPGAPQKDRTLRQKLETDQEATRIFDERYRSIIRSASESADRASRQYGQSESRQDDAQQEESWRSEDGQASPPSFRAYNSDFGGDRFRDNFAPRQPSRPRQADYAEGTMKKKKRGRGCLTALLVLLLLLGLCYGAFRLFGSIAKKDSVRERKPGVSTVLLAGTDDSGLRTDTLMLVTIDETNKVYNVLSIPRDTLTNAPYTVPKINGAYGYYGTGEAGMEALCNLVEDCVGFQPDGYVLIDWDGFSELVDTMGGISFDVPMDIDLDGLSLKAGTQKLSGAQALAVARFRAGYSLADLQRVQVQRQLVSAALNQWLTLPNLLKVPAAIQCVKENTLTNLNALNILWLARDLKVCSSGATDTLPGAAKMIGDGSYYVLDPTAVAETVNKSYNPYKEDITVDDLYIKVE
ncbi:MAG: LCP family protein [Oscillospiraceae bacterium]|nr:LCP family protein [Oscillospiraceae bacterium]